MTAAELVSWLLTHGWLVIEQSPDLVIVEHHERGRRRFMRIDGYWRAVRMRATRPTPRERADAREIDPVTAAVTSAEADPSSAQDGAPDGRLL